MGRSVVIVGAGPAGASTALLLARHGIDVTLIEREASFERVFRGEGLMPLGMDALLQIGVDLTDVPERLVRSWRIWIDHEEVFVIPEPVDELGARAVRVMSQPALLERLVAAAGACSSFVFERGARCADVIRDPGGRVVGIRLADGRGSLRADLVIGCDGRGSLVRTRTGLRLERSREEYDVLWCKLPGHARLLGECSFMIAVAAGAHPIVCYCSWDERLQLGVILPKGSAGALLRDQDWLRLAMLSAPGWLAEHVLAHRDTLEGPVRLTVLAGRCRSWTAPGVLLLGDAAHPMSPVRAQGINLALRDAIVAANHLRPALAQPGDTARLDAACRAVQAEREPEIIRAQHLQHREAQGQGDARASSWRFALAKRGARILGRYGWAQRAWLARQRDLRFGSTDVLLY